MNQKIDIDTKLQLTYEELQQIILDYAKHEKGIDISDDTRVHFRWGEPLNNIYATIDDVVISDVEETDD